MTPLSQRRTDSDRVRPGEQNIPSTDMIRGCDRYMDSLRAGRSGDRVPVGGDFSAPVQTAPGPTNPPIQWVPGLCRGVKRPGRGFDHPPHLGSKLKKEYSNNSTPPLGLPGLSRVQFIFTFTLHLPTDMMQGIAAGETSRFVPFIIYSGEQVEGIEMDRVSRRRVW